MMEWIGYATLGVYCLIGVGIIIGEYLLMCERYDADKRPEGKE